MIGLLITVVVLLIFILRELVELVRILTKQEADRLSAEKAYTEEAADILRALNGPSFERKEKYGPDDLPFDIEEKALNKR